MQFVAGCSSVVVLSSFTRQAEKGIGLAGLPFWSITDVYFKRLQQAHRHMAGSCQPTLQDITKRNEILGSMLRAVIVLVSLAHTALYVISPALEQCGQGMVP